MLDGFLVLCGLNLLSFVLLSIKNTITPVRIYLISALGYIIWYFSFSDYHISLAAIVLSIFVMAGSVSIEVIIRLTANRDFVESSPIALLFVLSTPIILTFTTLTIFYAFSQ